MYCYCVTDVLLLCYVCIVIALHMYCYCVTDVVLQMLCYICSVIVLQMYCYCITDVLLLHYRCIVIVLQMLTIHLDESDCFSAWVSAKDLGLNFPPEVLDTKSEYSWSNINYLIYWTSGLVTSVNAIDLTSTQSTGPDIPTQTDKAYKPV